MEVTAKVLADRIGGTIEGSADTILNQVAKIEDAGMSSLTFLANMEYEGFLYTTQAVPPWLPTISWHRRRYRPS